MPAISPKIFHLVWPVLAFFCCSCDFFSDECVDFQCDEEWTFVDHTDSAAVVPRFGMPYAGFYKPFTLNPPKAENGGVVRCTFDGSEPTAATGAFVAPQRVDSTMVVSCYEYVDTNIVAKSTQTYFIDEDLVMPVFSIRVDPGYLTEILGHPDRSEAIATDDSELPVHVEFFENGSRSKVKSFEVDAGLSLFGFGSRSYAKHSVAITMRKTYQKGRIKYPLFKTRPEQSMFKSLVLRNGGNRFAIDYYGDPMATSLLEGSGIDYQRSRMVVVFYNGHFWGIHDLREKINEHFIENIHGFDSKTVDVLKHSDISIDVNGGSRDDYIQMLEFVAGSSFADSGSAAYDSLKGMVDVVNFAKYMAAEIYYRNVDWPINNVRVWRAAGGLWKYIVFDVDQGFDWDYESRYTKNMFMYIAHSDEQCRGYPGPTERCFPIMFQKLKKNAEFRELFINAASVMYTTYLNSERVKAAIDSKASELGWQEVRRDHEKYPRDVYNIFGQYNTCGESFALTGSCLESWSKKRDGVVREEFREEFGLSGDISVTIESVGKGRVLLDGMELPSKVYRGDFFGGNGMTLLAVPESGAKFKSWEDGSTQNPRRIANPLDGARYKAVFE